MNFLKALASGRLMTTAILIGAIGFISFITGVFAAAEAGERPDRAFWLWMGSIVVAAVMILAANRISRKDDER